MINLIIICIISFGLVACAGKEPPPSSKIIDHQENLRTEQDQARLVDPSMKVVGSVNKIAVKEIRTRTLNNRMIVDFSIHNDRGLRDVINYRVRWLDPNGMMVTQYDPWETIALEGHEQSVLSLTAPTTTSSDFRIEIKTNQ
jgi:uncharacterized protein YcfL